MLGTCKSWKNQFFWPNAAKFEIDFPALSFLTMADFMQLAKLLRDMHNNNFITKAKFDEEMELLLARMRAVAAACLARVLVINTQAGWCESPEGWRDEPAPANLGRIIETSLTRQIFKKNLKVFRWALPAVVPMQLGSDSRPGRAAPVADEQ